MKRLISIIILTALALTATACQSAPDGSLSGNGDILDDIYDCFTVEAGYGGSEAMFAEAENADLLDGLGGEHLPIWRFDTLDEYETFIETYKDVLKTDELRQDYLNEEHFAEYSRLLVYKVATSGSYRYDMTHFDIDGEKATVVITQTNHPEDVTDDMAGWWICLRVDKKTSDSIKTLDALSEDFE